jgi:hypothetical protein
VDEKLKAALTAAKSAAHNFAIVAKGPTVVCLLVSKVPIKDAEVQAAKKEHGGTAVMRGKCQGKGGDFIFRVAKDPSVEPIKLKEFITKSTTLTVKPLFEVASDAETDEGKEAESEQGGADKATKSKEVDKPVTPAAKSPEPSKPSTAPPVPPPSATAADQLVATMNKLSPAVKQAIADFPDRKADILKPVAAFQTHVKAGDLSQAKAAILQIGNLLKTLRPDAQARTVMPDAQARTTAPTAERPAAVSPTGEEQEEQEGEEIDLPTALGNYQAARAQVVAQLDRLAAAVKASQHASRDKALMEIKAVRANLTAKPDSLNAAQALEHYLETDDVVADVDGPNPYGIAVALQQTMLPAVYELTACLS